MQFRQFNRREWREIYDRVQLLGKIIMDSQSRMDDEGLWHSPLHEISIDNAQQIEIEIKKLLTKNTMYLDSCGLRPASPLWIYENKDPTTWPSHASFIYKKLLTKEDYK